MIALPLHVYYNNNSLSSAYLREFAVLPRVGDRLDLTHSGIAVREWEWVVVEVLHTVRPVGADEQPDCMVICRPIWSPEVVAYLEPGEEQYPPSGGVDGNE